MCMLDPIKLEHFRNLVSLAGIDGSIDESERVALSKIAFDRGIALDRLNVMLNRSDEYVYLIPQNTQERESQITEMIKLALVDGEFSKAELELILTVGEKLSYTYEEIHALIEKNTASSIF